MNKLNRYNFIILFFIVSIAFVLRFIKLEQVPVGFYIDEASIGYNAYSILKTGKDEFGVSYPLYTHSFGSEKNPISLYAALIAIKIFGLNEFAVRLPAVLFGTLTVLLTFYLTYALFKNFTISLLASLFLAISPWHFHYSRIGFEPIVLPFFTVLLLCLLLHSNNNRLLLILSGIVMGLGTYSYGVAIIFFPLLWIGFIFIYRPIGIHAKGFEDSRGQGVKDRTQNPDELSIVDCRLSTENSNNQQLTTNNLIEGAKNSAKCKMQSAIVLGLFLFLILLIPHFSSKQKSIAQQNYFKTISIFSKKSIEKTKNEIRSQLHNPKNISFLTQYKITIYLWQFISNYFKYFTLDFLFKRGDISTLRHGTGKFGQLYLFQFPLIVYGLYLLLKQAIKGRDSKEIMNYELRIANYQTQNTDSNCENTETQRHKDTKDSAECNSKIRNSKFEISSEQLPNYQITKLPNSTQPSAALLIYWIVIFPIPASLTNDFSPHASRAITALPVFEIISAFALFTIFANLTQINWKRNLTAETQRARRKIFNHEYFFANFTLQQWPILFICILVFLFLPFSAFEVKNYFTNYFTAYPKNSGLDWHYGFKEAFKYTEAMKDDYDVVVVSENVPFVYIFVLFYTNYTPSDLQKHPLNWFGPCRVGKLGKYVITEPNFKIHRGTNILFLTRPFEIPYAQTTKIIYFPNGMAALKISKNRDKE